MPKFLAMVPVIMPGTGAHRRFKVEIQYDGELNAEGITKIRKAAFDHVQGKKIQTRNDKIEVYRVPNT